MVFLILQCAFAFLVKDTFVLCIKINSNYVAFTIYILGVCFNIYFLFVWLELLMISLLSREIIKADIC